MTTPTPTDLDKHIELGAILDKISSDEATFRTIVWEPRQKRQAERLWQENRMNAISQLDQYYADFYRNKIPEKLAKEIMAHEKLYEDKDDFSSGFNHGIWAAVDTIGEFLGEDEYAFVLRERITAKTNQG